MKTLVTIAHIFFQSFVHAGIDSLNLIETNTVKEVQNIIFSNKATSALKLAGNAEVIFTIDEDGKLNIQTIYADNYATIFHIRKVLDGVVLNSKSMSSGKTYQTIINFSEPELVKVF